MKKKFIKLSSIFLLLIFASQLYSDCNDSFYDNCSNGLKDYSFLKSFTFEPKNLKKLGIRPVIKYSNIFNKGSEYFFTICDEDLHSGAKIILKLYDSNNKLITSTYDSDRNKYYNKFKFPCKSTGVYYLEFSFSGQYSGCGMGIIGLKF